MPAFDNTAVASKLDLMADLLEIEGADKFRVLGYRTAAGSIRGWAEQVAVLANEGRLTDIPGVGAKTAAAVEQIIASGTFDALDEVSAQRPPGLAEVRRLPGVGPKRARLLHEKLGVRGLADLAARLDAGDVERLGGFGPTTALKIREALDAYHRHRERLPIGVALPIAESILAEILCITGVVCAQIVGSVRRRAETVGGIDLVAATVAPDIISAALREMPAVEGPLAVDADGLVAEQTDGHVRLELHDGTPLHVYLCEPDEFGATVKYRTGSVSHNEAFRVLASMRGVEVGERSVYRNGELLVAATEAQVFEAVGIDVMAPEVREGAETLARAAQESLPDLVEAGDVRGDFQSHSTYTDGKTSLAENRAVAAELGYEYLAATDHAYALRMVGGLSVADIDSQFAEIDALNAEAGDGIPLVLKGIELNIGPDGGLDYDDDVLARFDIVLASLHSGWDEDEATATRRVLRAIEHPLVDVIAHPTGRVIGRRDPIRLDVEAMFAAAGETGTIMEINAYPDRLDLSAEHIVLARGFGVRFSLGTDAHTAAQLRLMPYGVSQARRGLVTADELLNAQPWPVARTWLKRHRQLG